MRSCVRASLLLPALTCIAAAQATVVLTEGFEAPTHTEGLPPANGWVTTSGTVSKEQARTGDQSFAGASDVTLQQSGSTGRLFDLQGADQYEASAWAKTTAGGTMLLTVQYGPSDPTGRLLTFGFLSSLSRWFLEVTDINQVSLFQQTGALSGFDATQWNQIGISHDLQADALSFTLNGDEKASLGDFSSYTALDPRFLVIRGNTLGSSAASRIYFDDVSIEAVPEPASMAVLGLGLLVAARRRARS